jgi:hypothetical protein
MCATIGSGHGGTMKLDRRSVVWCATAALVSVVAYAKTPEIKSAWPQVPLKVDGTAEQWGGHLDPLPDVPILLGVANDGSYLYLCLKTSDPKVKAQIAHLGMTVWVNGKGKNDRGYGVRFPVGAGFHRQRREGGEPESAPPPDLGAAVRGDVVELIGPTVDDRFKVERANAAPIEAALGDDSGVMVVELRFPLQPSEDHPLAIDAKPGDTVAVGLEVERPKMERRARGAEGEPGEGDQGGEGGEGGWGGGRRGGEGGWGGGGYDGSGGFGRGGHHGGMGGGMGEGGAMPRLVKQWARVTLATAPAATAPATK